MGICADVRMNADSPEKLRVLLLADVFSHFLESGSTGFKLTVKNCVASLSYVEL